jgi:hypothetical protein
MFEELPSWAFYVRHVKGLVMKNISVKAIAKDYRPAYVFDDVKNLKMQEIRIDEDDSGPQIILKEVTENEIEVEKNLIREIL